MFFHRINIFFFVCLCLAALSVQAAEWRVAPGQRIADAITQAAPGDTVLIERGNYLENLKIDKTLHLQGVGRPTISGGLQGDTIRVTAPDVTIEGIIITNSGGDLGKQKDRKSVV